MKKLKIRRSTVSSVSRIFIADYLKNNDLQTGRKRREDVCDLVGEDRDLIVYSKINNKKEFLDFFEEIVESSIRGGKPLLVVEGHGEDGGLSFPSGDTVSWIEYESLLRKVVDASGGDLTVVALFCHSMKVLDFIGGRNLLPFSFYYGYRDKVSAGDVESDGLLILKNFLENGKVASEGVSDNIMSYSEYDYIDRYVLPILLLSVNPNKSEISLKQTISEVEREISNFGFPLRGFQRSVKEHVRSGGVIDSFIKERMHDTVRRDFYAEDIKIYLDSVRCGIVR